MARLRTFNPRRLFNTPFILLIPTIEKVLGKEDKVWPDDGPLIFCSYSSFGGAERDINGLVMSTDTGQITTWFRPDITAECRLRQADTGREYDIVTQPQNVEFRNQFLQFRVNVREGGA